ncbi:MAG: ATP-dependent DNA helicase [Betaproteobacteria bacterium]|nr:ATP-dependent DNA helicase [Betaproteobacteria bacterium]
MFTSDLSAVFGPEGLLARQVPGYRFRQQQLEMAQAVARAIDDRTLLLAEAGTGTGKTFAYLVPALLSGGRVVLSTGTKTLQDQLFERDLPLVREVLGVPVTVALLKGRANYVCPHHLERAASEGRFSSRQEVRWLHQIQSFARGSSTGDKAQLTEVPETAAVWSAVTSTRESCLGSDCPNHGECFVLRARREALAADLVVVNHHLFFADLMLRDEGVAELLPHCNTVVFDEAHQLPETATLFFGEHLSAGQVAELARDTEAAARARALDAGDLVAAAEALALEGKRFRLALGSGGGRWARAAVDALPAVPDALRELEESLGDLRTELEVHGERSEDLENCLLRCTDFAARLARWRDPQALEWVRWLEAGTHGWALQAAPLSVAEIFRSQIAGSGRAWIFTSATLAVNGDFAHYQAQLGLEQANTVCWDSPFDFGRQALLCVPRGLPAPSDPGHTAAVVETALPVLRASGGRAFLLFTTLRALDRARSLIADGFAREGLDFPLLVQGDSSRTELLERFRELGNAVLLGSQSFWEGVDVRGDALSLVVIDKLPFAPPDDPVLAARLAAIERSGGNGFMSFQVPAAAISLKQGAGRLIRSETDRGVLLICDPRLADKPYGKRLWRSLPAMRRSRELSDAVAFFADYQNFHQGLSSPLADAAAAVT